MRNTEFRIVVTSEGGRGCSGGEGRHAVDFKGLMFSS